MPEWLAPLLVAAALAVVGWVGRRGFESLHTALKELRDDLKTIADKQAQLDKDCVTWEEFNRLKADVTHQSTEIAVLRTSCKTTHGKTDA